MKNQYKMFMAHGLRIRYATALKAYIAYLNGTRVHIIADAFCKGSHPLLNAVVRTFEEKNYFISAIIEGESVVYCQSFIGTKYRPLRKQLLSALDNKGIDYKVNYKYNTSHNTQSKGLSIVVKAFSKNRAQTLANEKLGGDAVITSTYPMESFTY